MACPTDKHTIVSSFLEVAIGQTVDTALHFLQATNWRIEDALQLFYVQNEGRSSTSLSNVPPVQCNVLLSDHNHSLLEEHKRKVCAGQVVGDEACPLSMVSDAPHYVEDLMTHVPATLQSASTSAHKEGGIPAMSSNPLVPLCASSPTVRRQRRRNRVEMAIATSNSTPSSTKRQRKRTRAEIAAAASSSRAIVEPPRRSGLTPRQPRKSRARVHVFVVSSGTVATTSDSTLPSTPRKPRRTRAQMAAVSSIETVLPIAMPGRNATHQRMRAHAEPIDNANTPALSGPDLLTHVPTQTTTRIKRCTPTEGHDPRAESACGVPRRPRRTQIEMAIEANAPALYKRQAARIPKVRAHVCKGLGMSNILSSPLCLPVPTKCIFCDATKFAFECPTLCCQNGSIRLSRIDIPPELLALFTSPDDVGDHFRTFSRAYNNYFAFSCLGGNIDKRNDKGVFTFVLKGQIYHYLPNLLPDDEGPKFMQLYFYDGAPELNSRCKSNKDLRPDLVAFLINLTTTNPYASFFRSLRTLPLSAASEIRIFQSPNLDQRVYNAPTSDEVAAIIVDDGSSARINSPHIIVYGKASQQHRILHYYGCYDPLQYPLLFSKGESGWHQGLKCVNPDSRHSCNEFPFPLVPNIVQNAGDIVAQEATASSNTPPKEGKAVSCRAYYAYRFQIRPNNYIINTGRIFLQYIVDMYVKIENTRLDFMRRNQTLLRSELYQSIVDSVHVGVRVASDVGRRIILPATFIGGPRDMQCRYLNAMSLVQKYGKPDLFLTMTCNPNWPEVKDNLRPGEGAEHRPDLVACVFNAKVRLLRKEIMEKNIFGRVKARVDVIEFQKRGLPHIHMLIILAKGSEVTSPESFNQYVSAELPQKENVYLRSLVVKHMMHDPCGEHNPTNSCMKKNGSVLACKCNYPKDYAEFTTSTNDSYPIYRRRDNKDSVNVRGTDLDNRWVVPYNPYLLSAFDCHINVEICSTIQAVKYLYKYIYKGHDKVCFDIGRNEKHVEDEITSYQTGRWIGAPESAWRIFGFHLYSMTPAVIPLQVHLPHMHVVRFSERENLANIVENENRHITMLTAFFKANIELPDAKNYLYSHFPKYFTWVGGSKVWKKRQRPKCVGRLVHVSPSEGERYYLRLLLTNIRGSTSFADLLTHDGVSYSTFKEVADKYSLLQRDDYAELCMQEAVTVQMPCALRRLFATLLIFCESLNPQMLWDQFYPHLSEDFSHIYKDQHARILYLTYSEIDKLLESMGKRMPDFKLHVCTQFDDPGVRVTRDISDALAAPIPPQYVDAHMSLNDEQKIAYDTIVHHVEHNIPGAFFIDGPGGTGKTFLYCALYATIRGMGKIVLPTATSGIAASNMPTGRTAHSRFKIPIGQTGLVSCNVSKQSGLASLLRACSLIIWDEASMARKDDIEALDRLLHDICASDQIFGGKIIVFGGDFRQVLPVVPRKSQIEVVNSSLVSSYVWSKLQKFSLRVNIRAKEDIEFANFLLALGNGSLQNTMNCTLALPDMIRCYYIDDKSYDPLIEAMFPEMNAAHFDPRIFSDHAILTSTNNGVDTINAAMISKFSGAACTYKSFDSVVDDKRNLYPIEFLNSLCPSGMSPHELTLKKGCPVILLRNLDPSNGLCNGTWLICKEFHTNIKICEVSSGFYKGTQVILPRINLRPPAGTYPFQFERKQFPFKLCFAMTINKSQGQTLEQVCVYLKDPCFAHGQLYVGFSRARKRIDLIVFLPAPVNTNTYTNDVVNVISFDVLARAGVVANM